MQICVVNFCDLTLSNGSTPEMLNQAPWIWDAGYDGLLTEPANLDIQVQEFEPLPGKDYKHILDI
jgi:hypothetical protein